MVRLQTVYNELVFTQPVAVTLLLSSTSSILMKQMDWEESKNDYYCIVVHENAVVHGVLSGFEGSYITNYVSECFGTQKFFLACGAIKMEGRPGSLALDY